MKKNVTKNEQDIEYQKRQLQEKENKLKHDEMMIALEETKRIAGAYKGTTRKFVREDENGDIVLLSDAEDEVIDEIDDDHQHHGQNFDIAELVTDNQVLINRLDNILGEDEYGLSTRRSMDQSSEIESLTDSLIDGLFKQVKRNEA